MKQIKGCLILCLGLIFTFASCSKKNVANPNPGGGTTGGGSTASTTDSVDIYVAGFEFNGPQDVSGPSGFGVAKYWKNGKEVTLYTGPLNSIAVGISVVGNDIYVAGLIGTTSVYWKNGGNPVYVAPQAPDGQLDTTTTTGIFATPTDVYVTDYGLTGYANLYLGNYFDQNKGITAYYGADKFTQTNSVFVSGSDIYIGGSYAALATAQYGFNEYLPVPCYWKNNSAVDLPYSKSIAMLGTPSATVNSTFVSGADVYNAGTQVAGLEDFYDSHTPYPVYWKNDSVVALQAPVEGMANGIAVSGHDVYVAGSQYHTIQYQACYWKNGTLNYLPQQKGNGSNTTGIVTYSNDLYIAGADFDGDFGYTAAYWKNGNEVLLTDGTKYAQANGICVVKR
jgi:hypothetical protein